MCNKKNVSAPCLLVSLPFFLEEIATATEHACYKVQSNLHAHKRDKRAYYKNPLPSVGAEA